jgi:hypothetical protein
MGVMRSAWGNGKDIEEWRYVSNTPQLTVFLAVNSFQKSDDIVYFWTLWDYKDARTSAKGEIRSRTMKVAYRCKDQMQTLSLIKHFKGNVGTGQIIEVTDVPPLWERVLIDKNENSLFEIAHLHCSLNHGAQDGRDN